MPSKTYTLDTLKDLRAFVAAHAHLDDATLIYDARTVEVSDYRTHYAITFTDEAANDPAAPKHGW